MVTRSFDAPAVGYRGPKRCTKTTLSITLSTVSWPSPGAAPARPDGRRDASENPSLQVQGAGGDQISANDAATVLEARRTIDTRCGGTRQVQQPDVPGAVGMIVPVIRENGLQGVYETGTSERAERLSVVGRQVALQLKACGAADQATRLQTVLGGSS